MDLKKRLQNTLSAMKSGQSIRKAAQDWDIPRSTLGDRLRGIQDRRTAHSWQMKLSKSQEAQLTGWILT